MKGIYRQIYEASNNGQKLLAILIDPDKTTSEVVTGLIDKIYNSKVTHIFVGGSAVEVGKTENLVKAIKGLTELPIVIFPGDTNQISDEADGLLFLSLISGRNPDYLIGKHVDSVSILKETNLEVIPTGYILIENGKETAVQKVTDTMPLKRNNLGLIQDTAKAGELLGMRLIYLEAGSGATHPVSEEIIKSVKLELGIPLIVGGGIRSKNQLHNCYKAGADLVVIGTALEEDPKFMEELL